MGLFSALKIRCISEWTMLWMNGTILFHLVGLSTITTVHCQDNGEYILQSPMMCLYVNKLMCKHNNREGFLCSQCLRNHGPSAYSSKYYKCNHSVASATALYLTLNLLPVTILFILIVIFHINIIKGPMLGYVLLCQAYVIGAIENQAFYKDFMLRDVTSRIVRYSLIVSAIWNTYLLQVTGIIPPFCISNKLWDLDILLVNFTTVLFTLFLLVVTYLFIEFHAQNLTISALFCKNS